MDPAEIQYIVNSAINKAMKKAAVVQKEAAAWSAAQLLQQRIKQGLQGPPGNLDPPGEPGLPGISTDNNLNLVRWNAGNILYFNPLLDKSYSEGDIVSQGKNTYYHDVFLFVERVKDFATFKENLIVHTKLNTVLHGAALSWYMIKLSQSKQDFLQQNENGIEEWCISLISWFKELNGIALAKLTVEKYTIQDACN